MKQITEKLLAASIACLTGAAVPAFAQAPADYPARPVRIVSVSAAGGGLDIIGRLVSDRLTRGLGQPVVFENRPGAGGNIASEYVAKSPADGYTLIETTNSHTINAFIYKNPGYDPRTDFVAVVQLTEAPSVLIVSPRSAYRSLNDLLNAARAQPGKLVYGSGGSGSPTHIAMEMFKMEARIDVPHIPYKGGPPANQDVMGGQIPTAMAALPAVAGPIQAGILSALAVTSEKRWPTLPNVPTIAESGYPKFSHITWIGILVPRGTPAAYVARLNREIVAVLGNAEVRERIAAAGAEPVGKTPADFEAMLQADYASTRNVVSQIGLRVE